MGFTDEPTVSETIATAWPILVLFTLFDATQVVSGTFIRSTGKQCIGALLTSSAYFVFGIPLAWYLSID